MNTRKTISNIQDKFDKLLPSINNNPIKNIILAIVGIIPFFIVHPQKSLRRGKNFVMDSHLWNFSSSMTFYTFTTAIPTASLVFFIFNILHYPDDAVRTLTLNLIPALNTKDFDIISKMAIDYIKSDGWMTCVSIALSMYGFIRLIFRLENCTNEIWHSPQRSFLSREGLHFAGFSILGILLLFLSIGIVVYAGFFININILVYQKWIAITLLFALLFVLNTYLPQDNVSPILYSIILSAITAIFIFCVYNQTFLWLYKIISEKYSNTYGNLGEIFVLLLWVEGFWIIYLYLVKITYYCKCNLYDREDETKDISPLYKIFLYVIVACYFKQKNKKENRSHFIQTEVIEKDLRLPYALLKTILEDLNRYKLIVHAKNADLISGNAINIKSSSGWSWVDIRDFTLGDYLKVILSEGRYNLGHNYINSLAGGETWGTMTNAFFKGIATMQTKLENICLDYNKIKENETKENNITKKINKIYNKYKKNACRHKKNDYIAT